MGWGVRAFLLGVDGRFKRVPSTRYGRLWDDDSREVLPDHAGREAHFIVAYVELLDRHPILIGKLEFPRFRVRPDGRIDLEARDRGTRLALEGVSSFMGREKREKVIAAGHVFIKRQLKHEYRWEPTPKQIQEVERLIFGL